MFQISIALEISTASKYPFIIVLMSVNFAMVISGAILEETTIVQLINEFLLFDSEEPRRHFAVLIKFL